MAVLGLQAQAPTGTTARKKPVRLVKSSTDKLADKYFDLEEYTRAIEEYQKSVRKKPDDAYGWWKMGEAYRNIFQYAKAEEAYAKAKSLDAGALLPLLDYRYGQVLKINGKYEESKSYLETFASSFKPTRPAEMSYPAEATAELAGSRLANAELQNADLQNLLPYFKLTALPAPLNSKYMDYAPAVFTNDSIVVVTSHRPEGKGGSNEPRSGERFSDNFMFMRKKGAWVADTSKSDFKYLNTKVNDGAGVFNTEKTKYYYTSCSNEEACQLYVAELKNGNWADPTPLNDNVNSTQYSSKQPAVSFTGDTLWFVSDRPGGQGLNDIWMTIKQRGTEDWDDPVNLGPNINTPFVDMAPSYYAKERLFFFASNGREGYGGLDIFMVKSTDMANPKNLGLPFNTNRDDFGFVMGNRLGYMASNRDGGLGGDDVYSFDIFNVGDYVEDVIKRKAEIAKEPRKADRVQPAVVDNTPRSVDVKTTVKDANGNALPNAEVMVKNSKGETVLTTRSDNDGKVEAKSLPVDEYTVELVKPAVTEVVPPVTTPDQPVMNDKPVKETAAERNKRLKAEQAAKIAEAQRAAAEKKAADLAAAKEKADAVAAAKAEADQAKKEKTEQLRLVALANKSKSKAQKDSIAKVQKAYSDSVLAVKKERDAAALQAKLEKQRADKEALAAKNAAKAEELAEQKRLAAETLAAKKQAAADALAEKKRLAEEARNNAVVAKPEITPGTKKATRFLYESIYFDFDSHDLRPEAVKTLDEVISYAKNNPGIQLELNAYTDNIGNNVYNSYLSKHRGENSREYLTSNGLTNTRVVMNAKGSGTPVAANDNPTGRSLNRRVEIYVKGGPERAQSDATVTYISTSQQSVDEVASRYGMSASELKAMNNLSGSELKAFQPLRVKKGAGDKGVIAGSTVEAAKVSASLKPEVELSSSQLSSPAKSLSGGKYTSNRDETLYTVARLFGTTVAELKTLNSMQGVTLKAGQEVSVNPAAPRKGFYVVKAGDTFASIAEATGINAEELLRRNNLEGASLYEGMLVKLQRSMIP